MYKGICVFYLFFLFNLSFCINFKNNVCTKLGSYSFWFISKNCYYNRDLSLSPMDVIKRHGYEGRKYEVLTEDGYYLSLFRIYKENGIPVYLQHGIGDNGKTFCTSDDSLGFYLSNLGYDVWIGSSRGTTYSRKHIKYNVNDGKYWEYSLDEMAKYDIKANIDFIANQTGNKGSIVYIGHSMGTTLSLMHFSDNPESQKKVKGVIHLSPIGYMYFKNGYLLDIFNLKLTKIVVRVLFIRGLFYQTKLIHNFLMPIIIRINPYGLFYSSTLLTGKFPKDFRYEYLGIRYRQAPDGISAYQLLQYLQIYKTKEFSKYDWNKKKNINVYGQETPPLYNLNNFKIPLYMLWSENDQLGTLKGAQRLRNEVGSKTKVILKVPQEPNIEPFNHLTYIGGRQNMNSIYVPLANILKNLNK